MRVRFQENYYFISIRGESARDKVARCRFSGEMQKTGKPAAHSQQAPVALSCLLLRRSELRPACTCGSRDPLFACRREFFVWVSGSQAVCWLRPFGLCPPFFLREADSLPSRQRTTCAARLETELPKAASAAVNRWTSCCALRVLSSNALTTPDKFPIGSPSNQDHSKARRTSFVSRRQSPLQFRYGNPFIRAQRSWGSAAFIIPRPAA